LIGLDANVLVRYLTQDDKKQSAKVNALIEDELSAQNPGYITAITLVEVVWVLESCYDQSKEAVLDVLHALLTTRQLVVEKADKVYMAMRRFTHRFHWLSLGREGQVEHRTARWQHGRRAGATSVLKASRG